MTQEIKQSEKQSYFISQIHGEETPDPDLIRLFSGKREKLTIENVRFYVNWMRFLKDYVLIIDSSIGEFWLTPKEKQVTRYKPKNGYMRYNVTKFNIEECFSFVELNAKHLGLFAPFRFAEQNGVIYLVNSKMESFNETLYVHNILSKKK